MDFCVRNLSCRYSSASPMVLANVSFDVEPGKLTVILGPNGCGKTTLVRCMTGVKKTEAPAVFVDGCDLMKMPYAKRRKTIAYLPQNGAGDCNLSVNEILVTGLSDRFLIKPDSEVVRLVDAVVEEYGLSTLRDRLYCELSGGEKRIVDLSATFSRQTPFVILDEPASSFDISNEIETMDRIVRMVHGRKIAVVAVLHSLNMALGYADNALLLKNGRCIAFGSASTVLCEENLSELYDVKVRLVDADGRRFAVLPD